MNKSITCPAQSGTLSGKSVPSRAGHSERWHGRTPANILLDKGLSDGASRLFGIMTLKVFQGNVATVGIRKLADLTGKSKSAIHRLIQELVKAGHIVPANAKRGQRGWYVITSPVFGQKQRALDAGESSEESVISYPRRRLATVRTA